MKINKDSWHYKLWNSSFGYYEARPTETDLCRYCHRVFWRLVLWAALGATCVLLVGWLGYFFVYKGLVLHTGTTLVIVTAIGSVAGLYIMYNRWLNGRRDYQEPTTLVGKYLRASKQRVCPLVEFNSGSK